MATTPSAFCHRPASIVIAHGGTTRGGLPGQRGREKGLERLSPNLLQLRRRVGHIDLEQ